MNIKELNNLSSKEFAQIMAKSNYLFQCKCGYKLIQKRPFSSDKKDEKDYYIICPNCTLKVYNQFLIFDNEKIKTDITPKIHIKTK
jgi:predicted SprT family Zn-dependent metalloprotease